MLNDRFAHVTEWKKAFVEFKASDAYQHTKGLRKEVSTSGRSLGDAPPRRAAHRNVNKRATSKYIVNFVHMVQKYTGDDENKAKAMGKQRSKDGTDLASVMHARDLRQSKQSAKVAPALTYRPACPLSPTSRSHQAIEDFTSNRRTKTFDEDARAALLEKSAPKVIAVPINMRYAVTFTSNPPYTLGAFQAPRAAESG